MDYITIFGSCRQMSIREYMYTSGIQDSLNYPHYSREILQEILYLKYKNIPNEMTKYCFRSGLITNCTEEITDDKYNYLKNEFDKTTFFILEIASRISYNWNNLYMHHIAEEEGFSFYDRHNIIKKDLTDEEIEEDILKIRDELSPKKLLIVSHFSTYEPSKRSDLINLLENICLKYDIPFLNQTDIVKEYGINIVAKGKVMAHFTPEGCRIVGKKLFDKIKSIL